VQQKHNTTLQSVPPAEFTRGLERLTRDLADNERVVVPQEHTHIFACAN
jgi:hypothetical protein